MKTNSSHAFGPFKRINGNITSAKCKKPNVVKHTQTMSKDQVRLAQNEHLIKFKLVTSFLSSISRFITIGYRSVRSLATPMGVAATMIMEKNILGIYPDYQLDYPNISLTFHLSEMDHAAQPTIEAKAGNVIKVSWEIDPEAGEMTKPTDSAYIILYSERLQRHTFFINRTRSTLTVEAPLPDKFAGEVMHCWLFFTSANKKVISPTDYLGKVTLIR